MKKIEFLLFILIILKCFVVSKQYILKTSTSSSKQSLLTTTPDEDVQFSKFVQKYSKQYQNFQEERLRKWIFIQNHRKTIGLNKLYREKKITFNVTTYPFNDLTPEEFFKTRLGLIITPTTTTTTTTSTRPPGCEPFTSTNSLSSINSTTLISTSTSTSKISFNFNNSNTDKDWRLEGYVTPIKDQGNCGCCYAFAATGAIEGQWMKKYGYLPNLSEQNILDCSYGTYNRGCNGGWTDDAFRFVRDRKGINGISTYPYRGYLQTCKFNANYTEAQVTGFVQIAKNEQALENAVRNVGPIAVAIHASTTLQKYRSGIFSAAYCSTSVNHAVLVVGFNNNPNSTPYWIVKNSWGTSWGENGYFRLEKGKNACGIANYPSYPTV